MMATETTRFEATDYLTTDEARREFLTDALESGNAAYIAHAVGILARAHGMGELASATGRKRQALYRSLSGDGNPRLDTFFGALNGMGVKLTLADA